MNYIGRTVIALSLPMSGPSRVLEGNLGLNFYGLSPFRPSALCTGILHLSISWCVSGMSTEMVQIWESSYSGSGSATSKCLGGTHREETSEGWESGVTACWMVPGYMEVWETPPCCPQCCNFKLWNMCMRRTSQGMFVPALFRQACLCQLLALRKKHFTPSE